MKYARGIWFLWLLVGAVQLALADTEIRNFRFPLPTPSTPHDRVITLQDAIRLDSKDRQVRLNVTDIHPERVLHIVCSDEYPAWTVRVSWPGSSPTLFDLDILPLPLQTGFVNQGDSITPNQAALLVISARPLSPTIFHPSPPNILLQYLAGALRPTIYAPRESVSGQGNASWMTTFQVVLEPLILGVLPSTAVPAVWLLLIFGVGAAMCVPFIIRTLEISQQIALHPSKERKNR